MRTKILLLIFSAAALVSCSVQQQGATRGETYKQIYEEKSLSILTLPPINKSTKVEAKEVFYSSLLYPLAERGYYVMPPLLSMAILKEESAYDAEMFINNSMKRVGELFGVDAVLFTIIHDWSKTSIASEMRVDIEYILKSTKTDAVLFQRKGKITLSKQSSGAGGWGALIEMAANMVSTALTNEIIAGRQCNNYTLSDLPAGRYHPQFGEDSTTLSGKGEFEVRLTF